MPSLRNLRRVVLVWLLRACAFLVCAHWISSAAWAYRVVDWRLLSHSERTTAVIAVCTWHTVNSGFSPPQLLMNGGQKQIADSAQHQMAFEPDPAASFVVVESDFSFLVFKAAFNPPPREGDPQQHTHARTGEIGRASCRERVYSSV